MIDVKADARIKMVLGEQIVMIEALRDQVEDLKAKLSEREKELEAVKQTAETGSQPRGD